MVRYSLFKKKSEIKKFVISILQKEAKDIPREKIERMDWSLRDVNLKDITLSHKLNKFIKNHKDRIEFQKRCITENKPIQPLIVMYSNNWLVDGYARYLALKEVGIKTTKVYSGV